MNGDPGELDGDADRDLDGCSGSGPHGPHGADGAPGSPTSANTPVTGWLSEPQQEAWKAVVGLASLLPGPLDAQLQRDSGLTLFEYMVLSSLSMQPGRRARMSSLARLASGSLSRLSNVVKRLQDRGLVNRSADPDDGRFTVATLTDAGWDVVVAAAPGHVDAVRRHVLAPLDEAHLRILVDIAERLEAMPGPIPDC